MLTDYINLSEEVTTALFDKAPIVAMETSGVSGGSFPTNHAMAVDVDRAVRNAGAVPARIGVIDGRIKLGLEDTELYRLAEENSPRKISTRDLALAMASRATAGTTVSSSLIVAAAQGIKVFSVAGIGGVHRGAETSFDVSTDLDELARQRVAVVCAGAKSLLDPALTLEYLETKGIPVVGFGSARFPNYYAVSSGYEVPWTLDSAADLARFIDLHLACDLPGGVLITRPINEVDALPADELNSAVNDALVDARSKGIRGQALTPVVLSAISKATSGRSTEANRAVLISTAVAAAEIAFHVEKEPHSGRNLRP